MDIGGIVLVRKFSILGTCGEAWLPRYVTWYPTTTNCQEGKFKEVMSVEVHDFFSSAV